MAMIRKHAPLELAMYPCADAPASRLRVHRVGIAVAIVAVLSLCAACAHQSTLPADAGTGPQPVLPAPDTPLITTLKIARGLRAPPAA